MNRRRTTLRPATLAILLLGYAVASGCGGGGGGGGVIPPGVTASFQGVTPPGTISMTDGTVRGAFFDVEVHVNNIDDFAGAAFHVTVPANVTFLGRDTTNSILLGPGAATLFTSELVQNETDEVAVGAQLQGEGFCSASTSTPPGPGAGCDGQLLGGGHCSASTSTPPGPGASCADDGGCPGGSCLECPGGTCEGGIANATGLLIKLRFQATAATFGAVTFEPAAAQGVRVCQPGGGSCGDPLTPVTWTGGTLIAN